MSAASTSNCESLYASYTSYADYNGSARATGIHFTAATASGSIRYPESPCSKGHSKNTTTNNPINILLKLKEHWTPRKSDPDIIMVWAAAVLCFFGFFRAGEITTSTISDFDSSKHLACGDVAIDDSSNPQLLKVHLKRSKTDQLGKGVDIYIAVHYTQL